jgi:hypothetical protein
MSRENTEDNQGGGNQRDRRCLQKGYLDVRFMFATKSPVVSGTFNLSRSLKEFIIAGRQFEENFCILPLYGDGNPISRPQDVPNSKDAIKVFYRRGRCGTVGGSTGVGFNSLCLPCVFTTVVLTIVAFPTHPPYGWLQVRKPHFPTESKYWVLAPRSAIKYSRVVQAGAGYCRSRFVCWVYGIIEIRTSAIKINEKYYTTDIVLRAITPAEK